MKSDLLKILSVVAFMLIPSYSAQAVSEAGEIQRKEVKEQQTTMFVTNNITDFNLTTTPTDSGTEIVEPIDFSANEMINDEKNSTIIAKGDVEIKYNGMRLTTDKLVYNQDKDTIIARGKTVLYTADGAVINSTHVDLAENMSIGR